MIGALIGKGATADIFELDEHKVIKFFRAGYPLGSVRHEYENSKLLSGLDIPAAKSYELVVQDGRYGIVYDRIDGESMLDLLLRTEDVQRYARDLAVLHQKILAHSLPAASGLTSILKYNIERTDRLSLERKSKLMAVVDTLPDGDGFCHGDFHFGNVIVSEAKYTLVDYMNLCRGHRLGDIARTVYLIEMTPASAEIIDHKHIMAMKKCAADIYLNAMGVCRADLSDWLLVTAAARLFELSSEQSDEEEAIREYLSTCGILLQVK